MLADLHEINTIVGPNDAGKTNAIRALKLVAEALQGPVQNHSVFNHNLEVAKPFRIALTIELREDEKRALTNSLVCSTLMETIPGVGQTQALEALKIHFAEHELDWFFHPLFDDLDLTLEGSGAENYPPQLGLTSRRNGKALLCHGLGFVTEELVRPNSYTQVHPIGFLLDQFKPVTPSLEEYVSGKTSEMPPLPEHKFTIFDVNRSSAKTQAPVGLQFNRWNFGQFEPRYKELVPLQELRKFFRARDVPVNYETMLGLPDLVRLIYLDSVVSVSDVRGYPVESMVEKFRPGAVRRHDIASDRLPEFLFSLKNSDSFRDRQRYGAIQSEFTKLTEGAKFDIEVKTTESPKQGTGNLVLMGGVSRGFEPESVVPVGLRREEGTNLAHQIQVEVIENDLALPMEFTAAGVYELLLLASAMSGQSEKVILLDEPAQNIHPTMQNRLLSTIKAEAMTGRNQFLVVTHSPYFVSASGMDSTWRFQREGGTTRAINVGGLLEKCLEEDQRKILSKMESSDIRSLLFARGVVLVEGPSDKIVVEKVDQALAKSNKSCDLQNQECAVIDIGGKNNLGTFLKLSSSLHLSRAVVVDYDSLMRCDHVATRPNGSGIAMSAILFYLFTSQELDEAELGLLREMAGRMQSLTDGIWYSDADLEMLLELAARHKIFVFRKDLEGALQTKLTRKQSKPLKDLESVMALIESGKLPQEFYELGDFLLRNVH